MARDQGTCSTRRSFCRTFLGVLVAPGMAIAQASKAVRRIGVLAAKYPASRGPKNRDNFDALVASLRERGWIEGKNLAIEDRYGKGGFDELRSFAEELVRLNVEIIVAYGTPATLAAKRATTSIPIVMIAGDPVGTGLVASLARPGGNITGYSIGAPEMATKEAELIRELLPGARRVALIVPPKGFNSLFDLLRKEREAAFRSLGMQTIFIDVDPQSSELGSALVQGVHEAVRQQARALGLGGGDVAGPAIKVALGYRMPLIVDDRRMLDAGGLLCIEPDDEDLHRRVAAIIDKILRGAKPPTFRSSSRRATT
jgi:putative ABC transport system substrate-binding protein